MYQNILLNQVPKEMERKQKTLTDAAELVQLTGLISSTSNKLLEEWGKEAGANTSESRSLPSRQLYEAQRTLLAAAGKLTELISEPSSRLIEVSSSFFEARALHVATEKCIPDIVRRRDGGMPVKELGEAVGIEERKLCKKYMGPFPFPLVLVLIRAARVLRCLCSVGVFKEMAPDCFANNGISEALVGNEPLRAYILL